MSEKYGDEDMMNLVRKVLVVEEDKYGLIDLAILEKLDIIKPTG